jgi:hypothetical protein
MLGGLLHHEVESRKIPRKIRNHFPPTIQGNIPENFITINTGAKNSNLTKSYPELKPRLQDKKSSS